MTDSYSIPISVKGIIFEDGAVWLRKNERNEWELPGGKLDEGEQLEEALVRELKEELGFTVKVKSIIQAYLYKINRSRDESRGVLVLSYLCETLDKLGEFEFVSEAGKSQFKKFPISEMEKLIMPQFYKEAVLEAWNRLDS